MQSKFSRDLSVFEKTHVLATIPTMLSSPCPHRPELTDREYFSFTQKPPSIEVDEALAITAISERLSFAVNRPHGIQVNLT